MHRALRLDLRCPWQSYGGGKHLYGYLAEFDFRYSNRSAVGVEEAERAVIALQGEVGKRLTYRRHDSVAGVEG